RKRNFDFQLLGERQVDGKYFARFLPLCQLGVVSSRRRNSQSRSRLVHGCLTTQLQAPCTNRTATAFLPSWYCTASTVASTWLPPFRLSRRMWSPNSSGSVERNMAWFALLNSTTVASCRLVLPPRDEVTCTGIRTALACGKNCANCSAQLISLVAS